MELNDKVVLVTGGTGSFGSQFVATILERYQPRKVIVFSRDEHKQYDMQQSPAFRDRAEIRYFIGDVRDVARLRMAMRGVDHVVHAAALKHVPATEYNPFECIRTNVMGAENVITAAIECGVRSVIALSTDKAVNPINIYGASKLASDKLFVTANQLSAEGPTRFAVVRYGNVLASRGSIIPLFRSMIEQGVDSLPVTDERMTRFWISMRQGIDFVLSSGARLHGGEIFVPKVPSMRIVDVVQAIAPGMRHHVIGIRPGEKIHEVLISGDDTAQVIEMDDRYIICPAQSPTTATAHLDAGGKSVDQGFTYASGTNSEWLDAQGLNRLLT